MTNIEDKQTKRAQRGRKARAILAGGLIAAVGVGGTLATWNSGVSGRIEVRGSDAPPTVADGLLEVRDADGNWVSDNQGGAAALLAPITLQSGERSSNRLVSHVKIGEIRLTGISSQDAVDITGSLDLSATRADVYDALGGYVYLTRDNCSNAVSTPENPKYAFTPSAAATSTLKDAAPRTHTVTGPFEMNICMGASLRTTSVKTFTADDSALVTLKLDAVPAD